MLFPVLISAAPEFCDPLQMGDELICGPGGHTFWSVWAGRAHSTHKPHSAPALPVPTLSQAGTSIEPILRSGIKVK